MGTSQFKCGGNIITGIFYINFGLMILVNFFDFATDKN